MKLRNKKTGEIVDVDFIYPETAEFFYPNFRLVDFNELFEDYEEPKGYFYIRDGGNIDHNLYGKSIVNRHREIGNYFETEEEAEKAVEKLKAIKILKDNGFRFIQWEFDMRTVADGKIWFDVGVNTQWDAEQLLMFRPEVKESLDLLFGGEK